MNTEDFVLLITLRADSEIAERERVESTRDLWFKGLSTALLQLHRLENDPVDALITLEDDRNFSFSFKREDLLKVVLQRNGTLGSLDKATIATRTYKIVELIELLGTPIGEQRQQAASSVVWDCFGLLGRLMDLSLEINSDASATRYLASLANEVADAAVCHAIIVTSTDDLIMANPCRKHRALFESSSMQHLK